MPAGVLETQRPARRCAHAFFWDILGTFSSVENGLKKGSENNLKIAKKPVCFLAVFQTMFRLFSNAHKDQLATVHVPTESRFAIMGVGFSA